jgi:aryl-alcohol dehydrogenase-like predicted oxidoreductase
MTSKRHLGSTGIEITPIGLGTWQFSEGKGGAVGSWAPVPPDETDGIVRAALEGGINWFDTAELYGFGRSERGLARALVKAEVTDGQVVIATKWNPLLRTASSIRKTIGRRLECLKPFGIDLHQVHFPASFSSVEAEMNAMADLIEAKKIRTVGVSNFSAKKMRRAHEALAQRGYRLASNQVKYSILDRRIETNGTLEAARQLGITIIAYSPLEMGLLTGKFHKNPALLLNLPFGRRWRLRRLMEKSRPLVEALEQTAAAHSASAAQVALNWLVNFHGETVVAIPGATKVKHARESAGAMDFALSPDEMAEIDRLSRPRF